MVFWPAPDRWRHRIDRLRTLLILLVGLISAASLISHHGFTGLPTMGRLIPWGFSAAALGLMLELLLKAWATPRFSQFLRDRWAGLLLLFLLAVELVLLLAGDDSRDRVLAILQVGTLTQAYLVTLQVYVLAVLVFQSARVNRRLAALKLAPGRLVLALYLLLILAGTGLLMLPRATTASVELSFLDAFFTATSAVCVTGLIVVDTSTAFTPTGHVILAVLIQLGGLGIMAVTGFLALMVGQGLGIREKAVLSDILNTGFSGEVGRFLKRMVLVALTIELMGALLLMPVFASLHPEGDSVGLALFHSVSAYCNAGFSTLSDSLVSGVGSPSLNLVVMVLVALGGIGFSTLVATWSWFIQRGRGPTTSPPLTVRVVWITSFALWIAGTVVVGLLEWNGALSHLPWGDRILAAAFQSVTCRTAGFNTVDLASFSATTLLVSMVLMFIGGAPGSTAGGIKVTTIALMLGHVDSLLKGADDVEIGHRRISSRSVREAVVVVFIGGAVVVGATALLLLFEAKPFLPTAFEAVSALGTVGLSLGITGSLGVPGRLVLIVLMIIGRIGPVTLVLAVGGMRRQSLRYPMARIPVG